MAGGAAPGTLSATQGCLRPPGLLHPAPRSLASAPQGCVIFQRCNTDFESFCWGPLIKHRKRRERRQRSWEQQADALCQRKEHTDVTVGTLKQEMKCSPVQCTRKRPELSCYHRNSKTTARSEFFVHVSLPALRKTVIMRSDISLRRLFNNSFPRAAAVLWMLGAFEVSHKRSHQGMDSQLVCTENSICFLAACSEADIVCHTRLSRANVLSIQPRDEDQGREQTVPLSWSCDPPVCEQPSCQPLAVIALLRGLS
nr:uncharacterized protein LOC106044201 [Anser cygnoides]